MRELLFAREGGEVGEDGDGVKGRRDAVVREVWRGGCGRGGQLGEAWLVRGGLFEDGFWLFWSRGWW